MTPVEGLRALYGFPRPLPAIPSASVLPWGQRLWGLEVPSSFPHAFVWLRQGSAVRLSKAVPGLGGAWGAWEGLGAP